MDGDIRTIRDSFEPEWIAVLLLDGFSMLSLGAITEPFAQLQKRHPSNAPAVRLFGLSCQSVVSASGVQVQCNQTGTELAATFNMLCAPRAIIACGPTIGKIGEEKHLAALLRPADRAGIALFGIGQVVSSLAKVGLLTGMAATLHWKSLAAFRESNTCAKSKNALFVEHANGGTCAGELATLDLVMHLIERHAPETAEDICNFLLVSRARAGPCLQPGSQQERLRNVPQVLSKAVRYMADQIENSPAATKVARHCGVSVRQLERLFREHLASTPMQFYTSLKIERARELLSQTDMSLPEVSLACGFGTTANFSKKVRLFLGVSPTQYRKNAAGCTHRHRKTAPVV